MVSVDYRVKNNFHFNFLVIVEPVTVCPGIGDDLMPYSIKIAIKNR